MIIGESKQCTIMHRLKCFIPLVIDPRDIRGLVIHPVGKCFMQNIQTGILTKCLPVCVNDIPGEKWFVFPIPCNGQAIQLIFLQALVDRPDIVLKRFAMSRQVDK